MKKWFLFLSLFVFLFAITDSFAQKGRNSSEVFYKKYIIPDLETASPFGGLDRMTINESGTAVDTRIESSSNDSTFVVSGADGWVYFGERIVLAPHTVEVGDSALGVIFLDAADSVIKAGTGDDLVSVADLAP